MFYAQIRDGSATELRPGETVTLPGDYICSYQTVTLWTDAERAAHGIVPIVEPTLGPRDEITSQTLVVSNGVVTRQVTTQSRPVTANDVTAERNRRLLTFAFNGRQYQFDPESKSNVAGAGTLALAAIINGAQPGNLRWADANRDFTWLAADNTSVSMDAQTTFAFAQAAAKWVSDHIYAARAIKDMNPIPADYAADARWPS